MVGRNKCCKARHWAVGDICNITWWENLQEWNGPQWAQNSLLLSVTDTNEAPHEKKNIGDNYNTSE